MPRFHVRQTARERSSILLALGIFLASSMTCLSAQETAIQPENYALLIAVTTYEHAAMNGELPLQFPEKDARAVGALLEQSGYQVEYLLGPQATRVAILEKLDALNTQGNSAGVCVVGFFGHGVEAEFTGPQGQKEERGCFCPFDTLMRPAVNADGQRLFDGDKPLIEPDPETLVTMSEVVQALALAKAGSRLLIADCCREMPNRARGRNLGLGANFSTDRLPQQTVMLFGCKSGEKAWEQPGWGHGAFTKALLEELEFLMRRSDPVTTGTLADRVKRNVQRLTGNAQNPHPISLDSIDLQLTLALPTVFTNSVDAKMQLIPAGEFMMGGGDKRRQVRLTRAFYLGQTEVTVGQFRRFVEATGYKTEAERDGKGGWGWDSRQGDYVQDPKFNWKNPGFSQTDDHPVVQVSWNDAVAYCEWLSREEKRDYRLPTEAEWEYACRAGTTTKYSFGDDEALLGQFAWFADNSGNESIDATQIDEDDFMNYAERLHNNGCRTHPVGRKQSNPWGFYDMHGNACEWCSDWRYTYPPGNATDPMGPQEGSLHMSLGGSWSSEAAFCRSVFRYESTPSSRVSSTGFRVALSPSEIPE